MKSILLFQSELPKLDIETPVINVKKDSPQNFCLSDRNRKRRDIWGCFEAILRVLGLIYGKGGGGVENPTATNMVVININAGSYCISYKSRSLV